MLSMYYHELLMLACFMSYKLATSHFICCKVCVSCCTKLRLMLYNLCVIWYKFVCHVVRACVSCCTFLFVILYMLVCLVVHACACVCHV